MKLQIGGCDVLLCHSRWGHGACLIIVNSLALSLFLLTNVEYTTNSSVIKGQLDTMAMFGP